MTRSEAEAPADGAARLAAMGAGVRGAFMHIHKCAGTSLIRGIATQEGVISVVARPGNFDNRTGVERVPPAVWAGAWKFTFVRNPYARVLSAYKMFARSKKWSSCFGDFDAFTETLQWFDVAGHRVETEVPTPVFTRSIDNIIHHCSTFSNPKYRLDEMDFVGKVEAIESGIETVNAALGCRIPLEHLNRSDDRTGYREMYSARSRRIVERLYAGDIARFGYAF